MIDERKDSWALGLLLVFVNSLLIVLIFGRFIRVILKKIFHCDRVATRDNCGQICLISCCCCLKRPLEYSHLRDITL